MSAKPNFLKRAHVGLRHMFGAEPALTGARGAARAAPAVASDSALRRASGAIESGALRTALGVRGRLSIGKLSLVGLEEARTAYGAEALEARLRTAAIATIRKYMREGDQWSDLEDGGYVLVFAALSPDEAKVRCALIAQEISQWLLGTDAAKSIVVSPEMSELFSRDFDESFDLRKVVAGKFSASGAAPSPSHGSVQATSSAPASTKRQDGAKTPAAPAKPAPPPEIVYEPIWDARNEALLLFRPAARDHARLDDMMALRRVQNDLAALHARGRRIPVLLTLSAETLGHPRNRAGYFASVRDIPEAARRLLFIEAHASPQLVAVAAQCVREADARLALRCALNASGMRALRQVGASLVIANAESFPTLTKVLLDALDQFAEQAALCGLECALSGVRSESVAIAAVTAGFRFIAGPVVSAPLALLSEALRFHPADLYEADGR